MKKIRVLVIDDDPVKAAAYASAFDLDGFRMQLVGNGGAGFAALQMFAPDIVILDVSVHVKNGLRWLAAARDLPGFERLPVIVVTGASPHSSQFAAARAFGVQRVLSRKLWSPVSIVAAVRRAIRPAVSPLERAA